MLVLTDVCIPFAKADITDHTSMHEQITAELGVCVLDWQRSALRLVFELVVVEMVSQARRLADQSSRESCQETERVAILPGSLEWPGSVTGWDLVWVPIARRTQCVVCRTQVTPALQLLKDMVKEDAATSEPLHPNMSIFASFCKVCHCDQPCDNPCTLASPCMRILCFCHSRHVFQYYFRWI